MYLEDFSERIAVICPAASAALSPVDNRSMTMLCGLLADLATELLPSRPTRPGGAAEESRTPRRMEAVLTGIAARWGNGQLVDEGGEWREIDAELRAMGFLSPRHADAGGEP